MMRLRKIGFQQDLKDLDVFDAAVYEIISTEISRIESEELKRGSKRHSVSHRRRN